MHFNGLVNPRDLAMLKRVLDAHCTAHRIVDPVERGDMAAVILTLFRRGITEPAALQAIIDGTQPPPDGERRAG